MRKNELIPCSAYGVPFEGELDLSWMEKGMNEAESITSFENPAEQVVQEVVAEAARVHEDYQFRPHLWPHADLKAKCEPVTLFDMELEDFCAHLKLIMHAFNGHGLAAPQLGRKQRIFAFQFLNAKEQKVEDMVMINPVMTNHSEETLKVQEGCLSLPGVHANTKRWREIDIEYQDSAGIKHTMSMSDMNAIVFQHENDHLDGITLIEKVGPMQAKLIIKMFRKNKDEVAKRYQAFSALMKKAGETKKE